ncbi:response regulator transcription factor [Maribacter halichondriae]|uniref:response regulator transcription factor n=1 Tax=Maribacter halichondriae TaxID=2980554 RepID=UPI002359F41B|nr:response regulator transcription factor [Maribacter sp. Hal144]
MSYTVAIVDDHTLLSQAISDLVQSFDQFKSLYICKNGKELLDRLGEPSNIPDIVLMDINMPIFNGIETTEVLTEKYPDVKVLALSIEEDEDTILSMLRAGARGYLMKDTKREILEEALIQIAEKGYYHTNTVTQILVGTLHHKNKNTELKERELEFLKLACTEMTYKEIAEVMFLSPKTIEGYRDALHEKLQVKNRIGLVLYAIRNKIFMP